MNLDFKVARDYEISLGKTQRKKSGIYYTPKFIVDFILSKTITRHNIVDNPYPKIVDISCGCGNFLLQAYDELYKLINDNLDAIKIRHKDEYWEKVSVHEHIISNCIYGYDIDIEAVEILKEQLKNKSKNSSIEIKNIVVGDSLKHEFNEKFDYIIGNPPYVGHKQLELSYREFLLKEYKDVYRGKSDLYFCFCKKIIDILDANGKVSIIIPRYFLQSPSGKYLRNYIEMNTQYIEVIDFDTTELFGNIGVSNCILTMNKKSRTVNPKIYRYKNDKNIESIDIDKLEECEMYIENNEWTILNNENKIIYEKVNKKEGCLLGDIVDNFQGIITGCDKAFVIPNEAIDELFINSKLLKPWIKNKDVDSYKVKKHRYKLIYSNDIEDINKYEYTSKYIGRYKTKLENRRECKVGIRKWYELQWGRDKANFEKIKIIYPYKASTNRFAIDYEKNFFSADVYSFVIKEKYIKEYSYEYLVGILNSEIYNTYYQAIAKKIGKNIYDYYPNKVLKIKIFKDKNYDKIESLSKQILDNVNKNKKVDLLKEEINQIIATSLELK